MEVHVSATYEILALSPGAREVDWSTRLYLHPAGTGMTTSAYFLWLLQSPAGSVLVDTGFTPRLASVKGLPEEALPRTRDQLLRSTGVAPESIATVILTHLHWDHFDLEGWLPRATFWVQRRELEYWTGPGGRDVWIRRFISDCFTDDLAVLRTSGRLRTIEGNAQPLDGIRLEWVGGHSPGMQIVAVDTANGPFVIANDALTTYRNLRDWAPPAIHLNSIAECLAAMGRIRDLAQGDEGRICPGHDGEVYRRFPEQAPGVYRLA
jgi:glyoxylase-like metal-dependent hydrolase (beta-lactamase superfamily II)